MSDSCLCVLPWHHLFLSNLGKPAPCCLSQESIPTLSQCRNLQDVNTFYKSNEMRSIRESMLKGEEPSVCQKCFETERSGAWSYRQSMNQAFAGLLNEVKEARNPLPSCDPSFLDLRIGNKCNLKCRMCSPYSSALLTKEWNEFFQRDRKQVSKVDFNEDLLMDLPETWNKVSLINFAGGEPLISQKVEKILWQLIDLGRSSQVHLRFNTNLTNLPPRIVEAFRYFKAVDMVVSLDGFKEINSYIRFPSIWEEIIANIDFLKEHFKEILASKEDFHSFFQVRFNLTVQIYNIFSIGPLVNFLYERYSQKVALNFLVDPKHFCIQSLPKHLKKRAEETIVKTAPPTPNLVIPNSILEFMWAKDSSHHFNDFIKWTRFFDQSRSQNIKDIVPELKDYF